MGNFSWANLKKEDFKNMTHLMANASTIVKLDLNLQANKIEDDWIIDFTKIIYDSKMLEELKLNF